VLVFKNIAIKKGADFDHTGAGSVKWRTKTQDKDTDN
jgi:hypothetical protein